LQVRYPCTGAVQVGEGEALPKYTGDHLCVYVSDYEAVFERYFPPHKERIFVELMTSDRKFEASKKGFST